MWHYSDIAFAVLGLAKRWKNFGNDAEGKRTGGGNEAQPLPGAWLGESVNGEFNAVCDMMEARADSSVLVV